MNDRLLSGEVRPRGPGLLASVSFQDVLALALFAAGLTLYWYSTDHLFLFLAGYGLGRMRFARKGAS